MIRQFLPLSLFLLSVGCDPELRYDPIDKGDAGDGGQGDSGTGDGGPLTDGRVLECTTDSNCDSNAPKCVGHVCTICSSDEDCQSFAETPACLENGKCGECSTGNQSACNGTTTPFCLVGGSECVQCNVDSDCSDAANAKCDASSNTCVPCDDSAQCAQRSDEMNVCGPAGSCVQCTPATEIADCGDTACDPDTFECTDIRRGSLASCRACRSDSECVGDRKCVPVPFMGQSGFYCMQAEPAAAECPLPYRGPAIVTTSKSGAPMARYCAHNTNVTTCEAINSLTSDKSCTTESVEADCGLGARCEPRPTVLKCTYGCSSDLVCPVDAPCNEESSDTPYCGGPT